MITVSILINGHPILTRSAVNRTKEYLKDNPNGLREGFNVYKNDDGKELFHNPKDGAVVLAKMMLDTIHEVK